MCNKTQGGVILKINKRNIIVASLIVALGAAVYLNWQFGDSSSMFTSSTKELGETEYVNNDTTVPESEETTLSEKQTNYFSKARSERQESQDKIVSIAKEVLDKTDASSQAKESAELQSEKIENYISYQTNIENLLKAKGFTDCICCITDKGCSIVVPKSEVTDDSSLIIKDVVFGQTGIDFENIVITEI
jgi:stage III sporulation protein AH